MNYYYDTLSEGNEKFRPFDSDYEPPERFIELSENDSNSIKSAISFGFKFNRKQDCTIVCATSACDVWNSETEQFELDEIAARLSAKEAHKDSVNKASDSIRDGWMLCDTTPNASEGNHIYKSFLANEANRGILNYYYGVLKDKAAIIMVEFPSIPVKTGKGDDDWYYLTAPQVIPMYESCAFTTQALISAQESTLGDSDTPNTILGAFNDETITLEQFEAMDFVAVHNQNLDDRIKCKPELYAQPEDQPTQL